MLCAIMGMFSIGSILAQGDDCATALAVTPGIHTADGATTGAGSSSGALTGCFASGDATNADWYSFTPVFNGTMDVSACSQLSGVDTRLQIFDGSCAVLNCINAHDDCNYPTNPESELLGIPVTGGTTYYIEWDDRWSGGAGFDWELSFSACVPPVAAFSVVEDCGLNT